MSQPLTEVTFIEPIRLPTYQQKVGSLNCWRDSTRDPYHPDDDRPTWLIDLKERWVEIALATHIRERLGTNAERNRVLCVPLENVACFVLRDAETRPAVAKAKPAAKASPEA